MGILTEFVGENEASFAKETDFDILTKEKDADKEDQATAPAYQEIEKPRISRNNLDNAYYTDSLTFGMLNRKVQKILKAGYAIKTEKKSDEKKWDEFFTLIGTIGQRINQEELHERLLFDMFKFGWGYIEFVFDEQLDKVVDLKPVDARAIDWARDANQNIIFNLETQRPLGYVIKLDQSSQGVYLGDEVPEEYSVQTDSDQIFILSIRIAAIPLFRFGNGFEAVGLIEPSYLSKTRKDKVVEAITNELYIAGSNPIYGILGDATRKPSKQQKRKTLEAIQNFRHSSATVFEYPTEIHTLDVKHSDQYQEIIRLLKADQSNASGIPLAILDNTSDIPRSALNQMRQDTDIADQAIVEKYTQQFNKQILDFISAVNGFGPAKLVWGDVSSEDLEEKAKILIDAAKLGSGVLTPESIVPILSKMMNVELAAPEKVDVDGEEGEEVEEGEEETEDGKKEDTPKKEDSEEKVEEKPEKTPKKE